MVDPDFVTYVLAPGRRVEVRHREFRQKEKRSSGSRLPSPRFAARAIPILRRRRQRKGLVSANCSAPAMAEASTATKTGIAVITRGRSKLTPRARATRWPMP